MSVLEKTASLMNVMMAVSIFVIVWSSSRHCWPWMTALLTTPVSSTSFTKHKFLQYESWHIPNLMSGRKPYSSILHTSCQKLLKKVTSWYPEHHIQCDNYTFMFRVPQSGPQVVDVICRCTDKNESLHANSTSRIDDLRVNRILFARRHQEELFQWHSKEIYFNEFPRCRNCHSCKQSHGLLENPLPLLHTSKSSTYQTECRVQGHRIRWVPVFLLRLSPIISLIPHCFQIRCQAVRDRISRKHCLTWLDNAQFQMSSWKENTWVVVTKHWPPLPAGSSKKCSQNNLVGDHHLPSATSEGLEDP